MSLKESLLPSRVSISLFSTSLINSLITIIISYLYTYIPIFYPRTRFINVLSLILRS
jgi:hypothetical protein